MPLRKRAATLEVPRLKKPQSQRSHEKKEWPLNWRSQWSKKKKREAAMSWKKRRQKQQLKDKEKNQTLNQSIKWWPKPAPTERVITAGSAMILPTSRKTRNAMARAAPGRVTTRNLWGPER
jgi:hypothetical protein